MAADADALQVGRNGWRQGSLLPPELIQSLRTGARLPWHMSETDLLLVLSHDCDVTNGSFEHEPTVELLRLQGVTERDKDGRFFWGKNPRHYQIFDDSTGETLLYEAFVHDRLLIPRKLLAAYCPASS